MIINPFWRYAQIKTQTVLFLEIQLSISQLIWMFLSRGLIKFGLMAYQPL